MHFSNIIVRGSILIQNEQFGDLSFQTKKEKGPRQEKPILQSFVNLI